MSKTRFARLVRPVLLTAVLAAAAWIVARAPVPAVHASVAARPAAQAPVVGAGPNHAGIVISFGDGRVEQRCVAFQEQEIGGDELLQRSGLNDIVLAPEGTVCRINGKGCPSDNCFCQCPFPNCEYWAYYQRVNGAWSYSQLGATSTIIRDGSLDGWSWGEGDFQQGVEPPQVSYEDVCAAALTASTATPTATATQGTGAGTPPQASLSAAAPSVTSGQCTQLSWQTSGATSVTLDGNAQSMQGSLDVCPAATQTWTLIAVNAAGQTMRQVTVQVQTTNTNASPTVAAPSVTPRPAVTATGTPGRPTVSAPRPATPAGPRPIVTRGPQPLPGASPTSLPTADFGGGGVPLAPTAEPPPLLTPTVPPSTPTRYIFSLPPTETPRPRRQLGDGGGPTPTPLLVARVDAAGPGGSSQGTVGSAGAGPGGPAASGQLVASRAFTPELLPQYAAYLGLVGALFVIGWLVLRRPRSEQGD